MSRYLERAEHMARLLDLTLNLTLDQDPSMAAERWRMVTNSLRQPMPGEADAYSLTQHLTFEARNKDSMLACINAARENARQIREQISSEMWEHLNGLYLMARRGNIEAIYAQPHGYFGPIKTGAHLFQGLTDSIMSHGEGWHFIQLGRFIERVGLTASLLDAHFKSMSKPDEALSSAQEYISWVALLKSCTSFESYCQVYTADIRAERIAEFLLLNPESPRSVRFAAETIQTSLEMLARINNRLKTGRAQRLAGKFRATLDYAQVDEIMADNIHNFLENIQRQCAQIHTAVHQQYIAYSVEAALAS